MKEYIVRLEDGVWISPWEGDPGRTLDKTSAMVFITRKEAKEALAAAREYRPFVNAIIESAPTG